MASCTKIEQSLQSFIDGELSDSERLIFENHLHDCTACQSLLKLHRQCNATIFEGLAHSKYTGDMTRYVLEHLPEMTSLNHGSNELEQVNQRAKHPKRLADIFKYLVPLAATLVIVGLAYILKENWPETVVPDSVLGSVTFLEGQTHKFDAETDERQTVRLKTLVTDGDRFETDMGAQAMVTLLGPTQVKMDENTRIRIHNERRIRVEKGRVFIDVAEGSRIFRVLTPNGTVTVFGTAFEVVVENDETTVSVTEGEVQVEQGEMFKQLSLGEQVHVTQDTTVMKAVQFDVDDVLRWAGTIIPEPNADRFFSTRIAVTYVPDVVYADRVYHLSTHDHAIRYIELEWDSIVFNDSTGYQIYVYTDKDDLMFTGALNASKLSNPTDSKIRIYNNLNPQMTTPIAFVKIVADSADGEGNLNFINCSANLLK